MGFPQLFTPKDPKKLREETRGGEAGHLVLSLTALTPTGSGPRMHLRLLAVVVG